MRVVDSLPRSSIADVLGKQLLRAGTSVAANYRAACRGKSRRDLIHKLSIVEEEADECLYWMELLIDAKLVPGNRLEQLEKDIHQILAMTVASIKTLRSVRPPIQNPKSKIQNEKLDRS